ncbi:MAG: NYN domain-containing protein [Leptospiraceae bacterium]|nr:NYN domain-containing protein [Leptospiraceae bacterium]MDW7976083.1 NYN domain-containing protein [Leptospiraceae bacterium]
MILVIDGFNLIYKFTDLEEYIHNRELEKAITGLIEYLSYFANQLKKKPVIYVFFDGKKQKGDDTYQENVKGIHCFYGHDISADSLIMEFLKAKKANNVSGIKVISSDKKIQQFAKSHRYDYQSSEEFYIWLKETTSKKTLTNEKPDKITKKEVDYWLKVFKER